MPANPLGPEDLERLQKGITASEDAEQLITMAKQAGIDVAQFEQQNKETRASLLRLKNTFFPGQ